MVRIVRLKLTKQRDKPIARVNSMKLIKNFRMYTSNNEPISFLIRDCNASVLPVYLS